MKPQFIIAAPTSNSGKTTITLGVLRALKNSGVAVQSFKCGPDYIDPKFHEIATGNIGVNLDLYMMETANIQQTYAQHSEKAQAICIEGVMGLFDGAKKMEGSTAELAKLLALPIIMVVNAQSVAYSVAALLYGFKNFDPQLNIAGVIFNNVNTHNHYQFLEEACQDVGIPSLGYLPRIPEAVIPSRHLGLSIHNIKSYDNVIETIANQLEKTVDLKALLQCTLQEPPIAVVPVKNEVDNHKYTIAIAKDEAFNFSYINNIETLKRKGQLVFFSPIKDSTVPLADLIYLPGGYPELYLENLSQNKTMLSSIKKHAEEGKAIIAECGGMMYLGKSIVNAQGEEFPMAKVFDFDTSMQHMKLQLGYRTLCFDGKEISGHEFHYSTVHNDAQVPFIGTLINARGKEVATKLYRYKQVLASYTHFYFGTDELLENLIQIMNGLEETIEDRL